jgi:tripartite-type tricarboxylate transporter receptor subunit TctC
MNKHFVKRRLALATMVVCLAPLAAFGQSGDDWPSRAITLVVASGAGSGVDIAAREMAQKLSTALKQPVVVDNKPGGSGMLAGSTVARAKADGYTLLYSNGSFVAVAPAVLKSMSYDPVKDLTPIAMTASGGILLLVNKDVPANNLKELVALVKANPGTLQLWHLGQCILGAPDHRVAEEERPASRWSTFPTRPRPRS